MVTCLTLSTVVLIVGLGFAAQYFNFEKLLKVYNAWHVPVLPITARAPLKTGAISHDLRKHSPPSPLSHSLGSLFLS